MYFEGLEKIYDNGMLLSAKVNIALEMNYLHAALEYAEQYEFHNNTKHPRWEEILYRLGFPEDANPLFPFIQWTDTEPTKISDLLEVK